MSGYWALTRQDHGEQPFWLGTVLAAMLGQIGLPGGGIDLAMVQPILSGWSVRHPGLRRCRRDNKVKTFIPVARITDFWKTPAAHLITTVKPTYPDTRLVWWQVATVPSPPGPELLPCLGQARNGDRQRLVLERPRATR